MEVVTYCDPPSGWKFGFPKVIPLDTIQGDSDKFKQWLLDSGYPEKDIELALNYSRYWQEEVRDGRN